MPLDPDALVLTADVLGSDAETGEIRCKLGDSATAEGYSTGAAIYGPDGFIGRPNPPSVDGGACQALYVQDGDDHKIVGTRDNRWVDKVGTMDPGDRAIVTDAEARVFVRQGRSAVVLYTLNVPADKSMMIDLGGIEGQLTVMNGGAIMTMKDDEIVLAVNGGGAIRISADGVQITGACFQATTGAVQLGDLGGGIAPPQVPATSGVLWGPSPGTAPSSKVFVAP